MDADHQALLEELALAQHLEAGLTDDEEDEDDEAEMETDDEGEEEEGTEEGSEDDMLPRPGRAHTGVAQAELHGGVLIEGEVGSYRGSIPLIIPGAGLACPFQTRCAPSAPSHTVLCMRQALSLSGYYAQQLPRFCRLCVAPVMLPFNGRTIGGQGLPWGSGRGGAVPLHELHTRMHAPRSHAGCIPALRLQTDRAARA